MPPTQYGDSTHYIKGTLSAASVGAADVNVPLVIGVSGLADLLALCYSETGLDLVVTAEDGTLWDIEKVQISKTSGKLYIFVKFPSVSNAVDTDFYIQVGGETVNVPGSGVSVWTGVYTGGYDYWGVWHLNGDLNDSLGAQNFAVYSGDPTVVDGPLESCYYFDANADSLYIDSNSPTPGDALTLINWMTPEYQKPITGKGTARVWFLFTNQDCYLASAESGASMHLRSINTSTQYTTVYSANDAISWNEQIHSVITYDGNTSPFYKWYKNGALQSMSLSPTEQAGGTMKTSTDTYLPGPHDREYLGKLGPARAIQQTLSAEQILTHYNNENGYATNGVFSFESIEGFGGRITPMLNPQTIGNSLFHGALG